jgi:3-hydroxybutyryl-CoA dehydrogenase
MQIVVLTNESLKEELLADVGTLSDEVIYVDDLFEFSKYEQADAFIDLLFETEHIPLLRELLPRLVIINSVVQTLAATDTSFVRINGWPTLLKSRLIEASTLKNENKKKAEDVFSLFNKKIEWLPDETGFVTPRIVSIIINEAFIALEEGISTRHEIDTAMKLGTNYPYGPFEWAEKIGLNKISSLLFQLSKEEFPHTPSSLLQQESD